MCDEYDDERLRRFWRGLEEVDRQGRLDPEDGETVQPLGKDETVAAAVAKPRPRGLTR